MSVLRIGQKVRVSPGPMASSEFTARVRLLEESLQRPVSGEITAVRGERMCTVVLPAHLAIERHSRSISDEEHSLDVAACHLEAIA